ncbi:hypothetical protein ANCDUO_02857 [Ancylostoma duodenale]|uniref:Uncharacterized protein n=1 Tax=Ancylostoma duodenale TaxID=51022 RepID=A0A0C2DAQ5_9BILA|nr:hypothetical protein ANCDUO_02857 [Ancylostoma duodenale]
MGDIISDWESKDEALRKKDEKENAEEEKIEVEKSQEAASLEEKEKIKEEVNVELDPTKQTADVEPQQAAEGEDEEATQKRQQYSDAEGVKAPQKEEEKIWFQTEEIKRRADEGEIGILEKRVERTPDDVPGDVKKQSRTASKSRAVNVGEKPKKEPVKSGMASMNKKLSDQKAPDEQPTPPKNVGSDPKGSGGSGGSGSKGGSGGDQKKDGPSLALLHRHDVLQLSCFCRSPPRACSLTIVELHLLIYANTPSHDLHVPTLPDSCTLSRPASSSS